MDRQDIDALLIGALYGELTPADEARLTAHLDSHPTDRGALDDLKSARQAVRESRIFDLQLDPPQSVSALLLQEAHRRAPKRVVASEDHKESWFYRFSRMFLAHPAMAAAAMLVLVVGVAGTLYMRKGDQFASQELAPPALDNKAENTITAAESAADRGALEQGLGEGVVSGSGSSYRVGLEDKAIANESAKQDTATRDRVDLAKQQAKQNNQKTAIVVDTPHRQPKELEEPRAKTAKKSAAPADGFGGDSDRAYDDVTVGATGTSTLSPSTSKGAGAGGGAAPGGRVATTTPSAGPSGNARTPAPPPPANASPAPATVAQATVKPAAPAPTKTSVAKEAEKSETKSEAAPAKDSTLLAWAKGQHARTLALAKDGKCGDAAKVAVAIQNRAPDYYSQFMATDRALKKCQAYIAAERDAEAERSGKARAQKRVNADEPAATSK